MAAARCPYLVLMLLLSCCGAASAAADKKLTHLRFYFHEVIAGAPNATVVKVASLNKSASAFIGEVYGDVFDNVLREGPDPASRLIGRAQGFSWSTSLDGSTIFTVLEFVFSGDHGKYSGSTLTAQGQYYSNGGTSERSIVGGTGKLRFARGYMKSRVVSSTNTTLVVVIDVYFTLAHWSMLSIPAEMSSTSCSQI